MTTALLLLPLIAAHTVGLSAPVNAQPTSPEQSFAEVMSERRDAGWELRDLELKGEGSTVELHILISNGREAESLQLHYSLRDRSFVDLMRVGAEVPTEERDYSQSAQLFEELALGAPLGLSSDCMDYYLDFGSRAVSLDEASFRVFIDSDDEEPGQRFGQWMHELLDEGELVEIRDEREDDGVDVTRHVVVAVAASDGVHELSARLDGADRIVEVEWVLDSGRRAHQRYAKRGLLREHFDGESQVRSLSLVEGEWNEPMALRVHFEESASAPLLLAMRDFEAAENHSENCRF